MKNWYGKFVFAILTVLLLTGCDLNTGDQLQSVDSLQDSILIEDLVQTDNFREGALAHILEGEINGKGQAVGFHYDRLPTKKGEIIAGTETEKDKFGVYEAEVKVNKIEKKSNNGKSTFFPEEWNTQEVVDAINEAYEARTFISGNTYEGLTVEGIIIRMYLDHNNKIISAFPVYEGGL